MSEVDPPLPLNIVMSNKPVIPMEKRKFKFYVDEKSIDSMLDKKRRKHKSKSHEALHFYQSPVTKRDPTVYAKLDTENTHVVLNIPHNLLAQTIQKARMAAKPTATVYTKPEHWIVPKKQAVDPATRDQTEKDRMVKRMDSMRMFSRAAKCLKHARETANQIGPIRKKRSPVFDGLICNK